MTTWARVEASRHDHTASHHLMQAPTSQLVRKRVEKERISHRWFELANGPKTFDDGFDDTPSESGSSKMVNILEHAMDLPMFSGRHSWGDMRSAHADLRRRGSADEVDDAPFASSRPGSWTSSDGRPLLLPARSRTTNGLLKHKKT